MLIHRTRTGPRPPRPPRPPLDPISLAARLRSVRDDLERVSLDPPRVDRRPDLPPVDETILDVEPIGDDLRLRLHPALANAGELFVVDVGTNAMRLLYSGLVRPGPVPGKPVFLHAELTGRLPRRLPAGSELAAALADAEPGTVLLATNDLIRLLGRWTRQSTEVDVPVPVRVIQSGDGRRALVVPLAGAAATPLTAGPHRLVLSLVRRRWQTTAATDELSAYEREATLAFDL